jgi:hypothetical protein
MSGPSDSVQSTNQPPFDESWRPIIKRRSAELKRGEVVWVSWEELKRKSLERLRDKENQ